MVVRGVFGVWFPVCAAVGAAIAMGIFRLPHEVATHLPHPMLFIMMWIAGSLFCMLSACPLSELAATFPRSGGFYVFAHRAFGKFAGFIVGYMDWGIITSATSLIAVTAAELCVQLCGFDPIFVRYIAIALITGLTLVHLRSPKCSENFQISATLLKVLAFCMIVVGLFAFASRAANQTGQLPESPVGWAKALFLGFQAVLATFGGWALPTYFGGEVRTPGKSMPRAIFCSVLSISVIYLAMVASLVYSLPMTTIASEVFPYTIAFRQTFGMVGEMTLMILIFMILLSALSACILGSPRVLSALADDKLLLDIFGRINNRGCLVPGTILSGIVAIIFVATGGFRQVLAILALFDVLAYTTCFLSVFMLRHREPDIYRPYQAWGHPWSTICAVIVSLSFVVAAFILDTRNALTSLGIVALSVPIYLVMRRTKVLQ